MDMEKTLSQIQPAKQQRRRMQDPEYKLKAAERSKQWREKNQEWSRSNTKQWREKNKEHVAQYMSYRYATQKQAAKAWSDFDMQRKILDVYAASAALTQSTGVQHQVDHIVPLRNKTVCGLHVWWNLQVITAEENKRKSAKFDICAYPEQGRAAFT
jgi:5-methylcytosine-specific restriction endonuclease McrA